MEDKEEIVIMFMDETVSEIAGRKDNDVH